MKLFAFLGDFSSFNSKDDFNLPMQVKNIEKLTFNANIFPI